MDIRKDKEIKGSTRLDFSVASRLEKKGIRSVVAGVSGGADSVALLHALLRAGIEVVALHCNFHLRGEESMRDESFVKDLCLRLGVALETVDFDVDDYRARNGGSVEMACRELRYEWFEAKRKEYGADRIAVAHNSDDNAETLLLNLFRGAGIAGLRAMKEDTGKVIRPLLDVSRKEIEGFLEEIGQDYIIDSTNLSSDYRRNFIRNEVIPVIEREWPDVKRALNRTSANMADEESGAESFVEKILEADILPYDRLCRPVSGRWLLRKFVIRKGGTDNVVKEIARSVDKGEIRKGAQWSVSEGKFILGFSGLEWIQADSSGNEINEAKFSIQAYSNSDALLEEIKADRSNTVFWTSLPLEQLEIRGWREGDRIKPLGMKGSKLVSEIIREAKLSANRRRGVAVIAQRSTGEILWVEGLKRSRTGLVKPDTADVTKIGRK